jgi:uncharacterized coiled-coil DUF342 family protein
MTKQQLFENINKAFKKLDNLIDEVDRVKKTLKECHALLEEIPESVDELDEDDEE